MENFMTNAGGSATGGGDGAFERFVTAAIAAIITIMFSWRLLAEITDTEYEETRRKAEVLVRQRVRQKPDCNAARVTSSEKPEDSSVAINDSQVASGECLLNDVQLNDIATQLAQDCCINDKDSECVDDDVQTDTYTTQAYAELSSPSPNVCGDLIQPLHNYVTSDAPMNTEYRTIVDNEDYVELNSGTHSSKIDRGMDEGEANVLDSGEEQYVGSRSFLEPIMEEDSDDLDSSDDDDYDNSCVPETYDERAGSPTFEFDNSDSDDDGGGRQYYTREDGSMELLAVIEYSDDEADDTSVDAKDEFFVPTRSSGVFQQPAPALIRTDAVSDSPYASDDTYSVCSSSGDSVATVIGMEEFLANHAMDDMVLKSNLDNTHATTGNTSYDIYTTRDNLSEGYNEDSDDLEEFTPDIDIKEYIHKSTILDSLLLSPQHVPRISGHVRSSSDSDILNIYNATSLEISDTGYILSTTRDVAHEYHARSYVTDRENIGRKADASTHTPDDQSPIDPISTDVMDNSTDQNSTSIVETSNSNETETCDANGNIIKTPDVCDSTTCLHISPIVPEKRLDVNSVSYSSVSTIDTGYESMLDRSCESQISNYEVSDQSVVSPTPSDGIMDEQGDNLVSPIVFKEEPTKQSVPAETSGCDSLSVVIGDGQPSSSVGGGSHLDDLSTDESLGDITGTIQMHSTSNFDNTFTCERTHEYVSSSSERTRDFVNVTNMSDVSSVDNNIHPTDDVTIELAAGNKKTVDAELYLMADESKIVRKPPPTKRHHSTSDRKLEECDSLNRVFVQSGYNLSVNMNSSAGTNEKRELKPIEKIPHECQKTISSSKVAQLETMHSPADVKPDLSTCDNSTTKILKDVENLIRRQSEEEMERDDHYKYQAQIKTVNRALFDENHNKDTSYDPNSVIHSRVKRPSDFVNVSSKSKRKVPYEKLQYKSVLLEPVSPDVIFSHVQISLPELSVSPSQLKLSANKGRFFSDGHDEGDVFVRQFQYHKLSLAPSPGSQSPKSSTSSTSEIDPFESPSIDSRYNIKHISELYSPGYFDRTTRKPCLSSLHENCIFTPERREQLRHHSEQLDSLDSSYSEYETVATVIETDIDACGRNAIYDAQLCNIDFQFQKLLELERSLSMTDLEGNNTTPRKSSGRSRFANRMAGSAKSRSMQALETNLDDELEIALAGGMTRAPSIHELRVSRSLSKLNVPDWYKTSSISRSPSCVSILNRRDSRESLNSISMPPSGLNSPCTSTCVSPNAVVIRTRVVTTPTTSATRRPKFSSSLERTPEKSPILLPLSLPSDKYRKQDKSSKLMPIPIVPFMKLREMFEKQTTEFTKFRNKKKEEGKASRTTTPTEKKPPSAIETFEKAEASVVSQSPVQSPNGAIKPKANEFTKGVTKKETVVKPVKVSKKESVPKPAIVLNPVKKSEVALATDKKDVVRNGNPTNLSKPTVPPKPPPGVVETAVESRRIEPEKIVAPPSADDDRKASVEKYREFRKQLSSGKAAEKPVETKEKKTNPVRSFFSRQGQTPSFFSPVGKPLQSSGLILGNKKGMNSPSIDSHDPDFTTTNNGDGFPDSSVHDNLDWCSDSAVHATPEMGYQNSNQFTVTNGCGYRGDKTMSETDLLFDYLQKQQFKEYFAPDMVVVWIGPEDGGSKECVSSERINSSNDSKGSLHANHLSNISTETNDLNTRSSACNCQSKRTNTMYESACMDVMSKVEDSACLIFHLSRFARACHDYAGEGVVTLAFDDVTEAQDFILHGTNSDKFSPSFLPWSFIDISFKSSVLWRLNDLCFSYNPDSSFMMCVLIACGACRFCKSRPPQCASGCTGLAFTACKFRLFPTSMHEELNDCRIDKLFIISLPLDTRNREYREKYLVDVQRKMKQNGASLRHNYSDLYKMLINFVAEAKRHNTAVFYPTKDTTDVEMCLVCPEMASSFERLCTCIIDHIRCDKRVKKRKQENRLSRSNVETTV